MVPTNAAIDISSLSLLSLTILYLYISKKLVVEKTGIRDEDCTGKLRINYLEQLVCCRLLHCCTLAPSPPPLGHSQM